MSDEAVKKQIEGVCEEITEKNGWTTFAIDVGSQYPIRLSTKLEAVIKHAREAGDKKSVWTFTESQGGENPNKPGTHYINRRLEKVEVGGEIEPALAAVPAKRPGQMPNPEGRDVSIERQVIVKSTIAFLPTGEIKTADDWFAFIDRLDAWMTRERQSAPAEEPHQAAAADAPAPVEEDGIPF